MLNLGIRCVLAIGLFYLICFILISIIVRLVKKFAGLDVQIGSVGIMALTNVKITGQWSATVVITIEKIWISSCYLNGNTKSIIGVCLSGCRVEVDLPKIAERKSSRNKSDFFKQLLPKLYSRCAHWLHFHLDNVCLTVKGGPLGNCIAHVSFEEFFPEVSKVDNHEKLALRIHSFQLKILCVDQGHDMKSPILCDIQFFSLCLEVMTKHEKRLFLKGMNFELMHPNIRIHHTFFHHIQTLMSVRAKDRKPIEIVSNRESVEQNEVICDVFFKGVVEDMNVQISEVNSHVLDVSIQSITSNCVLQRGTHHLIKSLFLQTKGLACQTKTVNLGYLNHLQCELNVEDEALEASVQITGSFFGYHHEEWKRWINVMKISKVDKFPAGEVSNRPQQKSKFLDMIKCRQLKVAASIRNISAAIATEECSGIKLGLAELRFNFSQKLFQDNNMTFGERKIDLEMTSFYVKLTEGGAPSIDLSSRVHHLDTIIYLGLLVSKCIQNQHHCSVDTILDNLQVELSTEAVSVFGSLISSVKLDTVKEKQHSQLHGAEQNHDKILQSVQLNGQCTNINMYVSYQHKVCTCIRLDQVELSAHKNQMEINLQGTKLMYHSKMGRSLPICRTADIDKDLCFIKHIDFKFTFSDENKSLSITTRDNVTFQWSMVMHLCLYETLQPFKAVLGSMRQGNIRKVSKNENSSSWNFNILLQGHNKVVLKLQNQHNVTFSLTKLCIKRNKAQTDIQSENLLINFDGHQIVDVENFNINSDHHNEKVKLERSCTKTLTLASNRLWMVTFNSLNITFPFGYNFAHCFDELKLCRKWIRLVRQPKPKNRNHLSPDVIIRIQHVRIQVNDDAFEVKLGDNYKLALDEYSEHEKRVHALNIKIQDLRKKHGLLPSSKVDELYESLEASISGHYIRRSKGLYISSPQRDVLWSWSLDDLDISLYSDPSFTGVENVLKHMKDIDPESPVPPESMTFVTLWGRYVNVGTSSFVVGLRDYPLPLMNIQKMNVWGRLIGAEQNGTPKAKRSCRISQGEPWGDVFVEKNMPALKFYHDFSCDISQFDIAYGGCWEPTMAQFNLSLSKINQPSVDPSRPLPFWDKLRLLLHGRLTMSLQKMRWLYHASLDPYNKTEVMDWTWTHLILDWMNAKWVLRGDLDIYARTASKYDDCRLLHLPNLRFTVRLMWITLGNPNDHHSVEPCAPEKRTLNDQDSYANFRSQNYDCEISFETKQKDLDVPGCLFYASTLRWMDKVKMCIGRVSRPIRRGHVFKHVVMKKTPLSRHVKHLTFNFSVHQFEVDYWASFARQSGVRGVGGPLMITVGAQLNIKHIEDGLSHRPLTDWQIKKFNCDLQNVTMWLRSIVPDKRQSKEIPLQRPVKKSYFLSVENVMYERADTHQEAKDESEDVNIDSEVACHRVKVHNLKGAWTPSNRDVAFSLYDAYVKSQRIKKNLSSEALHRYKVENSHNKHLNTSGAKALFMLSSPKIISKENDPTFSMLQKLVSESDTKFVAANEEMPEPEVLVRQLRGIAVCEKEDVTMKKWHVELYNSQAVLRGAETSGYVIVSAAKVSLLSCDHKPIWQSQQLQSKSTLIGSVESMQYYATVESPSKEDDIVWLSKQNIMDSNESSGLPDFDGVMGLADMVAGGQSVGGVVTNVVHDESGVSYPKVQLQRIVSRCHCEFFYAGYGEIEDKTLPEIPLPPDPCVAHMMEAEEGVDCITLLHHDLNICTNSVQYDIILDIINNLLLHVEPKKKERTEKLQSMRFSLQLASVEDQKTPILQRQNNLRDILQKTRKMEKDLFMLHQLSNGKLQGDYLAQSLELHNQLESSKEIVNGLSEELAIMVSCFKESQLQLQSNQRATVTSKEAHVSRLYEVCFKHAEWRMTEDDGQIGIADLVLKNFLYRKTNCEDDSGSHHLDLGWVKVTNLLPCTPYKDVLLPTDPFGNKLRDRRTTLRFLCKFKAPVGGISLKEHFEVNVSPLTIQLTARFYRTVMSYFFREKNDTNEETEEGDNISVDDEASGTASTRSRRKEENRDTLSEPMRSHYTSNLSLVGEIDKMKERAAKNNMFLYTKITEVPLRVSYKGDKEKNITNINDFQFLCPTLEYHDQTWTWHDLALAVKNDTKRKLIGQAVQQKLNIKMHLFDLLQDDVHEDVDKAKMLLGTKFLPGEKKVKKHLFGSKKS